jgi:DNA polymerase
LHAHAIQAVEGRRPRRAAIMLLGEQPGDEEDQRGEPFIGPAGTLLAR